MGRFTPQDWGRAQALAVLPGDDSLPDVALSFEVFLDLTSSSDPALSKRRVVPGTRAGRDAPAGWAPQRAIPVLGTLSGGLDFRAQGSLLPVLVAAASGAQPLSPLPPGAAAYYNLSTALGTSVDVEACGNGAPMRVAAFAGGRPIGSSGDACPEAQRPCPQYERPAAAGGCAGFSGLQLAGGDGAPPYMFAVSSSAPGGGGGFVLSVRSAAAVAVAKSP